MQIPGQFLTAPLVHRMAAQGIGAYERESPPYPGGTTGADRYLLVIPEMRLSINGIGYYNPGEVELDLSDESAWDSIATDYRIAANRAGKDFRLYACKPARGRVPDLLVSVGATAPSGYTVSTSRKIGMFHCGCADVGTISGHTLSGYLAGDILPRSIQDLLHRPYGRFLPGFVWGGPTDFDSLNYAPLWASIYPLSGTGASIASVFGAAATVSRNFYDFADDLKNIGARMMTDWEFAQLHTGSPEETNIFGSANPTTVGGHVDTASRRIVSNIGLEDMSGVWWTWLQDRQSYIAGADYAASIAFTYENISGARGSHYGQGTYPTQTAVFAGGAWDSATICGSRARSAGSRRSAAYSYIGCRAVAESQ